ncbi:MAG: DUF4924 family protein [Alloprevotella sp.]|nr:DUF4924 family protein [Alloprevotella sp.]
MIIANRLRQTNRAEYILYMWQVEDILRSYHCDMEHVRHDYLVRFTLPDDTRAEMEQWYANLCNMMKEEGVAQTGHLQINKNAVQELVELNSQLLDSEKFPYYQQLYYKVLPYIVEIRAKGADKSVGEIETALQTLYGLVLLRLQGKEVSPQTLSAAKDLSTLLGQLSDYYLKNRQGELDL